MSKFVDATLAVREVYHLYFPALERSYIYVMTIALITEYILRNIS